jgi:hypothetical protein
MRLANYLPAAFFFSYFKSLLVESQNRFQIQTVMLVCDRQAGRFADRFGI